MSTENNRQLLEAMYGQLWSILFPDGELFAALSQSLHPRPSTMLYDLVGALGVTADSLVLDAGCGQGQHSCALARQFGCHVIGLDLVATNLDQARATAKQEGLSEQVSFLQGDIQELLWASDHFDLIWCRDMLAHVQKIETALSEFARVLKPQGAMVCYVTAATDLLEPQEALRLYTPLNIVPTNMSPSFLEHAFTVSGLQIAACERIGSEWKEYQQENKGMYTPLLLHLARLQRNRDHFVQVLGEQSYALALAADTWEFYQFLGKLCPMVYTLRKVEGVSARMVEPQSS